MTTIDKVAICGIRSYDPNGLVVIKFFKPLTIILGNNGCGKTTIIEALKYVCTGDVPPLSERGRTFVHDPNHCGVNVVKAQVKVAFKTRDGRPVIVNSSMQLTQKPRKTEFKTIDGVVRMYDENTNEQIALSHKCADMKKVVPELMGVSRAILDNVIFCHQEEAAWPLSEAKKLKEKFDQIFATSRWSKALVNITQYRKTLNARAKDLKTDLKVFENNKQVAHKLVTDLQQTKIRMAQYKDRSKKYNSKIQQYKDKLTPLREARGKLAKFDGERRVLENDINHFKKQQRNAHQRMHCEYEESDGELEEFLKNHDAQICTKEKELEVSKKEYEKLKRELRDGREKISELHSRRGKIEQIVEDNKNKRKQVHNKMNELMERYDININNAARNMNAVISALKNGERNKKKEMEQQHKNALQTDQLLETEINNYVTKKNKFDFRAQELAKQSRDCNAKRQEFSRRLNHIKQQLDGCQNIQHEIASLKSKIEQYKQNNDPSKGWEEEINQCQKIIEKNSERMRKLNIQRRALQNQSAQTAKLQFKSEQYEKANALYNKSLSSIKGKVTNILQSDNINMDVLQAEFNKKNKSLRQQYEAAQRGYNKLQRDESVTDSQLSSLQSEKDKISRNLSQDIVRLSQMNLSLDDNINALISEARDNAQNKQADLALAKCGRTLYSKFNKLAKNKNQCPVCQRHFGNNRELNSFIKTNTSRIKNVEKSGAIEKHENAMNKTRKKLQSLQSLHPIYENAKKQQKDLQDLEKQFKKMSVKRKKNGEELEEMFARHIENKSAYDKSSMLITNVNELCRQYRNLQQQRQEYETEKVKLKKLSQNKRNLNDVSNEYDEISNENNQKNMLQQRLRVQINEYDKKKRVTHNKLIALQEKSANYDKLSNEENRMKKEVHEMNENLDNFNIELTKTRSSSEPLSASIKNKRLERQQQRSISQSTERKLQEYLAKYSSDIHSLQSKMNELNISDNNLASDRYSNLANNVKKQELAFKALQEKYNKCELNKHNIEKWLDNVVVDKQDLQNNLEFRKFDRLVKNKKNELNNLKLEMKEIHSTADNISIQREIEELQTNIAISQSNLDQHVGGSKSEKLKAVDLMATLQTDRYKDIDEKYRQQLIKHETVNIAYKDLDKFEKALDKSLIEFHSLKMREINSVLKELWQQTYRGKDIDYIEIVSEIGNTSKQTTKRKNYNYNVIMKQGDASLTMRGRCSAGQRVLASLLIRLALAETFCLNCGVLALDEPTTNLDSKNIEALAYSLNQIITRRKRQENFQLILITHDENFVEKLGQREHTDGYYRVFKNDFQHSKAKLYKFDASQQNRNRNNNII